VLGEDATAGGGAVRGGRRCRELGDTWEDAGVQPAMPRLSGTGMGIAARVAGCCQRAMQWSSSARARGRGPRWPADGGCPDRRRVAPVAGGGSARAAAADARVAAAATRSRSSTGLQPEEGRWPGWGGMLAEVGSWELGYYHRTDKEGGEGWGTATGGVWVGALPLLGERVPAAGKRVGRCRQWEEGIQRGGRGRGLRGHFWSAQVGFSHRDRLYIASVGL
jgi:hypothetical protein